MEIADCLSCDLLSDDSYKSRKVTDIRISEAPPATELSIESKKFGVAENLQSSIEIELERVETTTVEQIYTKLGNWLHSSERNTEEWKTRPVDGKYYDGKERKEIGHLEIEISEKGIKISGITPSGSPVQGAASIPPAVEIHDETASDMECFYRVHSLLGLFLAGQAEDSGDLFELSGHFVNPEKHLHQKLTGECVTRLESGDYIGVIQKAGETLESYLEQSVPESIEEETDSGTNQAQRAFNSDQEGFLWGYERAEQQGIRALYEGGFKALRNPASHGRGEEDRNRYLDDVDQRDAVDTLCFVNFLIRKLDEYGQEDLEIDESEFDL